MLHIITESNKELKNRVFPLPDGVRKILQKTLEEYKGDKTIEGYKRLNNILDMNNISYNEMKRIKNFFDNYKGTDKSFEYILNGGDAMKTWVNNTLNTATKAVHDFKQTKKDAGISNAFIKSHSKDRQNKKKNKPTQTKIKTNNRNILNNTSLKYEGIIRESLEIEDYYFDYGVSYVLDSFLNSEKGSTQDWGVLISPSMYQKALTEFTRFGQLQTFPSKYVYQWFGIILKNSCMLEANTMLAGHTQGYPYEEVEDFLRNYIGDKLYDYDEAVVRIKLTEQEFLNLCNEANINEGNGIHKDGQYDLFMNQEEVDNYDKQKEKLKQKEKYIHYQEMANEYNKKKNSHYKLGVNCDVLILYKEMKIMSFLDEIGLFDWMVMPDGSEAWSDFGIEPIFELLSSYNDNMSPEETLVLINKVLDVYHQRGDLSSIFITGGSKTLSRISGTLSENKKKIIIITEQQEKILKEAADDQFSTQELSAIPSFKGKVDYCTKHLGQYIGKGSSRITFQIDDEKVLKLAFNGKGVAQNIEEDRAYGTIFPKIFESDDNGLWIISEFVLPCKAQDFKHCFGLTFKEFQSFISSCGKYRFGKNFWNYMPEEKWIELIENNEELAEFDDYIGNYGHIVCGDMERICNYGLTKRNGQPTIVLLDSGLTEDVYYTHYKKW